MKKNITYTENEMGEIETEIKAIFKREYVPSFLVKKANKLLKKWKIITNWQEDNTPAIK
jgi:hypothetical protein